MFAFSRSLRELKSTRTLALTALLIALNLVLDLTGLTIRIPPNLRIGFGFLTNAAVGMLFGPTVGIMTGICTDVLGYFAGNFTMGGYFPGYTLTAMLGGMIYGLWLYKEKVSIMRCIGAKLCVNLFCNIGLNTLWLTMTGGKAWSALLPARVVKNALLLPIEVVLLYFGMQLVLRLTHALSHNASTRAQPIQK